MYFLPGFFIAYISLLMITSMPQSGIFITIAFGISTLAYFYQISHLLGALPLESQWDINMLEPATSVYLLAGDDGWVTISIFFPVSRRRMCFFVRYNWLDCAFWKYIVYNV